MVLSPQKSVSGGIPSHHDTDHGSPPLHRHMEYDSDEDDDDTFVKSKPPHAQQTRFPFDEGQFSSPEAYQERAL